MNHTRSQRQWRSAAATLAAGSVLGAAASASTFSLDDNPSNPLTTTPVAGLLGAEDPYGLGLPASVAGLRPPSPSLIVGPWIDAALLAPDAAAPVPRLDVMPPVEGYLDAVSGNHAEQNLGPNDFVDLRFSIDRATAGVGGSASRNQAALSQQSGDIYKTLNRFPHPSKYVGTLPGGPYAGVLPHAGVPNVNRLVIDEARLDLTAGNGVGVLVDRMTQCPPIMPGTHDNVDAFTNQPHRVLDLNGDGVTEFDYYFSSPPAEFPLTGKIPAGIYDIPAGMVFYPFVGPYATPAQMGLDQAGDRTDNIDGLVMWDYGTKYGPAWGGPGAEPALDFALFTLSPGSASLAALALPPCTVFFTDFTGAFATYATIDDLGLDSALGTQWSNVDALEICHCLGDLDGDCDTDQAELGQLLAAYGSRAGGDLDGDGDTDQADLGLFLSNYGCN